MMLVLDLIVDSAQGQVQEKLDLVHNSKVKLDLDRRTKQEKKVVELDLDLEPEQEQEQGANKK